MDRKKATSQEKTYNKEVCESQTSQNNAYGEETDSAAYKLRNSS